MSVNLPEFPEMPSIKGVKLNAVSAGIKKNNQLDLMAIVLPSGSAVSGVFTKNAFKAAPVTICQEHLAHKPEVLLVNSGNANACTGEAGFQAAIDTCRTVADVCNLNEKQVLPFSTGVIGEPLPSDKITAAIPELIKHAEENNWSLAAQGIMTTDTAAKGATQTLQLDDETIVINGIAKGAGMINPDMATMLGFVVTNANIEQSLLDKLTKEASIQSFNRITIDGDTSTNDSCIVAATGESSIFIDSENHPSFLAFKEALIRVHQQLAQMIVRDGEGATKYVSVQVEQGKTPQECFEVAYQIAHSPLVKTALFASDPNWGRLVMAIGNAEIQGFDVSQVNVFINNVLIVENGCRAQSYTEEAGQSEMDLQEITLRVCLGRGECEEVLWTTDLSHEYVTINAEYRT